MNPVSYREARRLVERFRLTPSELAILVAVLDHAPRVSRAVMDEYVPHDGRSFDVQLCRLNKKLPATIRISSISKGGNVRDARRSVAYVLSSEWAREHIMQIARGEPAREQGRAA